MLSFARVFGFVSVRVAPPSLAAVGAFWLWQPALVAALASGFLPLSLVTFGGVNVVLPALFRLVVTDQRWLGAAEFYRLLALAFAAPGPNMLFVTMIGARVAGFWGALIATVAMVGPPALLVGIVSRYWFHQISTKPRRVLQAALLPLTCGIFAAAAFAITQAVVHGPVAIGLAALMLVLTLRTRVHPLLLLILGAAVGIAVKL